MSVAGRHQGDPSCPIRNADCSARYAPSSDCRPSARASGRSSSACLADVPRSRSCPRGRASRCATSSPPSCSKERAGGLRAVLQQEAACAVKLPAARRHTDRGQHPTKERQCPEIAARCTGRSPPLCLQPLARFWWGAATATRLPACHRPAPPRSPSTRGPRGGRGCAAETSRPSRPSMRTSTASISTADRMRRWKRITTAPSSTRR